MARAIQFEESLKSTTKKERKFIWAQSVGCTLKTYGVTVKWKQKILYTADAKSLRSIESIIQAMSEGQE